jgi:hypothetical protein
MGENTAERPKRRQLGEIWLKRLQERTRKQNKATEGKRKQQRTTERNRNYKR